MHLPVVGVGGRESHLIWEYSKPRVLYMHVICFQRHVYYVCVRVMCLCVILKFSQLFPM
jgi:hypothetical protein